MRPVILADSRSARDGWVVVVTIRKQTVLLKELFSSGYKMEFRLSLPHIAQHLDVAGDLFPRPFYAGLLEIIDEKLVPPPGPTTRKGRPWRLPVFTETLDEYFFYVLGPDLACAILEHLVVFALGGDDGLAGGLALRRVEGIWVVHRDRKSVV